MDRRKKEAWRAWTAEPIPENAQRYCAEHARTERRSGKDQLLSGLGKGLQLRVSDTLKAAVELYLDQEWEETYVEDLDGLTECHFWLLENVSPSVLRRLSEFYEKHGMTLREGDEPRVRELHGRAKSREQGGSRWKARAQTAESSLKFSKSREEDLKGKIDDLKKEIKALERDEGVQRRDQEIADLHHELSKSSAEVASMAILRRENERLTKLLQEKSKQDA